MPSTVLEEKRDELRAKAEMTHQVLEEGGDPLDLSKVKCLGSGLSFSAKLEKFRQLNTELGDLNQEVKDMEAAEDIAGQARAQWSALNQPVDPMVHPGGEGRHRMETRSLGRLVVESDVYKSQRSNRNWATHLDLPNLDVRNTVFRTGAGYEPENIRIPRLELDPQRPIAVIDNIPMLPTDSDAIRFMRETTFTNNAAETAESTATTGSDLIGEAALALTEITVPVEWLPVFLPVTIQQMQDVPGIEAYIDSRLMYMVRARLDSQVLAGDGNTPNLEGTENVSNIQSQALGTDTEEDAIFKLFTSIRDDGFAEPSVCFIRPAKFQNIRLRKTADGQYIWGPPSLPGPFTIWGVPLVQSTAVTSTKAIAGDYAGYSALYTKRGMTVDVSDSHSHYFTRGMLAVRVYMRVAMVHFRPKAFGEVTGL